MRKAGLLVVLGLASVGLTLPSFADKFKADTTLKDSQPYGVKDKEHKHQVYDLSFEAQGKAYTCRTDSGHSMNATDFVVGSPIHLEIDGNKAKIKTPANKKAECEIVRVQALPAAP
jgi:hypothetical protein